MGSEQSPGEYIARMVEVFREVRRVLRDDGLCWVNIGSTYAGGGRMDAPTGYKSGDLVPIPWLLGIALQRDGWWLRMDTIWQKKSPMPESVDGSRWVRHRVKAKAGAYAGVLLQSETGPRSERFHERYAAGNGTAQWADCPGCAKCSARGGYIFRRGSWRPTRAHEYILQLAKSPDYWADKGNVEEEARQWGQRDRSNLRGGTKDPLLKHHGLTNGDLAKRNPRSVRTFKPGGSTLSHYAMFPVSLPDWCIRVSTSHVGCCPECGKQWARVIASIPGASNICPKTLAAHFARGGMTLPVGTVGKAGSSRVEPQSETLACWPSCACGNWTLDGLKPVGAPAPVPCRVLDPFSGAGTTALAAKRLGRDYYGIELNPEYVALAQSRLSADAPLFGAKHGG